jgi:putative oxidoreductase
MTTLFDWLLDWPERIAKHLTWLAPLFARIVVGWVFMWSGWGKLHNLPAMIENFRGWGIPFPQLLTPFVSGVEFFGGIFLLLGLMTRISAGALGVTMIVAIKSAKWGDVDSLETLLGFDETEYLALFLWLAIAGASRISLDYVLQELLVRWRYESEIPDRKEMVKLNRNDPIAIDDVLHPMKASMEEASRNHSAL